MKDDLTKLSEAALRKVEQEADEPIQSAMVKTAIRTNIGGDSAEQTSSMEEVLNHMSKQKEE
ncbi:hypothetical protein DNHGIG_17810 [Collibacillus ludicampi]|jgi:hypothetical protein|uniref:Uncharacterized protein n=1 Tax=Collibacillus ludicampi TaxID=2771369 RepID=A0AAV4LEK1_9BACL|nr:hypothetical protein [Collibacillus ludicampi]GIM46232.1 hypothetical protein DNHGIG_17810 [Collibacillus ludicampi]